MTVTDPAVEEVLARYFPRVNEALRVAITSIPGSPERLAEAMAYSVDAGGKRVRPALCFASCEAVGGDPEFAEGAAVALELVHTYSLIHDDLPCMDDDDLRRGKPTNHRVYGEALAVLAGDALLTRAFAVLADDSSPLSDAARMEAIRILAAAAGAGGMVGGQALDLETQGETGVDLPTLQYIHTHKTGALFSAACRLGGICGGADASELSRLGRFGEKTGLAFQIVDDVLDVTSSAEELGKTAHKDQARGKATYPALLGLAESRERLAELEAEALEIAATFAERGHELSRLARLTVRRAS